MPNVIIETERGHMRINEYINHIKEESFCDLENSFAYDIYNINIAEYTEVYFNNILLFLSFVKYINDDNNENKNLLILTNVNGNHFNLAYFNNSQIDFNYIPNGFNNNENGINLESANNINSKKNRENIINKINKDNEILANKNEIYKLKDLTKLSLT